MNIYRYEDYLRVVLLFKTWSNCSYCMFYSRSTKINCGNSVTLNKREFCVFFKQYLQRKEQYIGTDNTDHPEPLFSVTTPAIISKVPDVAISDCWLNVRELADAVHISIQREFNILHEYMSMKMIFARWVKCFNDRKLNANTCLVKVLLRTKLCYWRIQ